MGYYKQVLLIVAFNSKVSELENKIKTPENKPDISCLANKTELKNLENKIPDSNAFVKKLIIVQKSLKSKMIRF